MEIRTTYFMLVLLVYAVQLDAQGVPNWVRELKEWPCGKELYGHHEDGVFIDSCSEDVKVISFEDEITVISGFIQTTSSKKISIRPEVGEVVKIIPFYEYSNSEQNKESESKPKPDKVRSTQLGGGGEEKESPKRIPNLSVYPNPASEEIHIEYDNSIQAYLIIDPYGNVLLEGGVLPEGVNTLIIEHLSNGVYFLHLQTESKTLKETFIKH